MPKSRMSLPGFLDNFRHRIACWVCDMRAWHPRTLSGKNHVAPRGRNHQRQPWASGLYNRTGGGVCGASSAMVEKIAGTGRTACYFAIGNDCRSLVPAARHDGWKRTCIRCGEDRTKESPRKVSVSAPTNGNSRVREGSPVHGPSKRRCWSVRLLLHGVGMNIQKSQNQR